METRKEMKKNAKHSLKKHYWIFVVTCLVAAFFGTEFSDSLEVTRIYSPQNIAVTTQLNGITASIILDEQMDDLMNAMLDGNFDESRQISGQITHRLEATKEGKKMKGRGVLAEVINSITSGSYAVTILSAARSILGSDSAALAVFILGSLLLSFLMWFFLLNLYRAVSRRIFLEGRIYDRISIQRFLFFARIKKWTKAAFTMFMSALFLTLWSLTIVGGIIKRYSYYMVPYIVAENPDISPLRAITLSRRMMYGHKWECFVFELSFLGWDILSVLTLGTVGIFYVNPYKVAAFSEYYTQLRGLAKVSGMHDSELLNDVYLYEKARQEDLKLAYADIIAMTEEPEVEITQPGIRGFLARNFSITLFNRKDEQAYEESQVRQLKIRIFKNAFEGRAYPTRLFAIPERMKRSRMETVYYMRHYSVWSLILLFFTFAFIGWLWEVSLHLISDGEFVNRGVLHGPWLPIYGYGGILILVLLTKMRRYPALEFVSAIVLCGCIEYFTAYYLELTNDGMKWWDYSGYFLNLHGRICAEGLLVFGIGGMAIVYILAPLLDNQFRKIPYRIAIPLCAVLLTLYIGDSIYSSEYPNSGKGITRTVSEQIQLE